MSLEFGKNVRQMAELIVIDKMDQLFGSRANAYYDLDTKQVECDHSYINRQNKKWMNLLVYYSFINKNSSLTEKSNVIII